MMAAIFINFNEEMCPECHLELDLDWMLSAVKLIECIFSAAKCSYSVLTFSSSCHFTSTEDKIER